MPVPHATPALTRAAVTATITQYRAESRGPERLRLIVIGFFGLIGGPTLVAFRAMLALPGWLDMGSLLAGWVILVWSVTAVWKREQGLRRIYQLPCPHCGAPLLAPGAWSSKTPPADLAAALRTCPHCGAVAIAD